MPNSRFMKHSSSAALLLSLVLAAPGFAADKKKKPTPTPSGVPPTSPMLVVPKTDANSTDGVAPSKIISSEMSGRDLEFFTKAVDAGREQAYFVEMLKKSASSDQIKKLADALTATQNEENMHIAKLASQKGWTVSLEPTPSLKKAGAEIAKLSGSNLDQAAMDKVVTASGKAMATYQEAAQSEDPQIKNFALQMLPLAEEKRHLVEKMTGVGAKAANQLFRHGASQATGEAAATPVPAEKSTLSPAASPALSTPAAKGTPTPKPSVVPVATPPGQSTSPTLQPPIIPSKG